MLVARKVVLLYQVESEQVYFIFSRYLLTIEIKCSKCGLTNVFQKVVISDITVLVLLILNAFHKIKCQVT